MSGPPQILIVDDDRFVRVTLRDCLSEVDCVVREASDGEQALQMIDQEPPAIVFLDLVMPRLSGLDVLRRLRQSGVGCHVLIISSMDVESLVEEAVAAGANGFISKPFHPLEISAAARRALHAEH